jgi:Zn-dependent M28 family amino/carboxypeptidase
MERERQWIVSELKATGAAVSFDRFQARTPDGMIPMANIIGKFSGKSGQAIAVSGHYDSKKIPGVKFLGANDAGSSTGFLLEFARAVSLWQHNDDIYVVFFDGEEAVRDWTETDSRYGSRHLAAVWLADGTLKRLKALINVDMIGDKDLDMVDDLNSDSGLRQQTRAIAAKLGYSQYFRGASGIDDDHRPFAELGVRVLDLIDLDYGPNNSYWHTAQDTIDKLSAQSLQVVGDITLQLVKQLDGGASS